MMGPVELGTMRCLIDPLPSTTRLDGSVDCRFPPVDLNKYRRGTIIKIDITVLAPSAEVSWSTTQPSKDNKIAARQYIEQETITALHNNLKHLPPQIIALEDSKSPNPPGSTSISPSAPITKDISTSSSSATRQQGSALDATFSSWTPKTSTARRKSAIKIATSTLLSGI